MQCALCVCIYYTGTGRDAYDYLTIAGELLRSNSGAFSLGTPFSSSSFLILHADTLNLKCINTPNIWYNKNLGVLKKNNNFANNTSIQIYKIISRVTVAIKSFDNNADKEQTVKIVVFHTNLVVLMFCIVLKTTFNRMRYAEFNLDHRYVIAVYQINVILFKYFFKSRLHIRCKSIQHIFNRVHLYIVRKRGPAENITSSHTAFTPCICLSGEYSPRARIVIDQEAVFITIRGSSNDTPTATVAAAAAAMDLIFFFFDLLTLFKRVLRTPHHPRVVDEKVV